MMQYQTQNIYCEPCVSTKVMRTHLSGDGRWFQDNAIIKSLKPHTECALHALKVAWYWSCGRLQKGIHYVIKHEDCNLIKIATNDLFYTS